PSAPRLSHHGNAGPLEAVLAACFTLLVAPGVAAHTVHAVSGPTFIGSGTRLRRPPPVSGYGVRSHECEIGRADMPMLVCRCDAKHLGYPEFFDGHTRELGRLRDLVAWQGHGQPGAGERGARAGTR